ncbi:MAG: carboxypeptidase regulatory-like domain-containing protein [Fimbriimonadaceae bacterium]|nr:carboxypeptidase regulatory-like domain-containing protein [Fimbriimonadaceae bacterium]
MKAVRPGVRWSWLAPAVVLRLLESAPAALIPGSDIQGRVVWADGPDAGTGVPDVTVDCRAVNGQYPASTTTDAQGNYQFTGLPPRTYELNAIVVCREYMWPRNVTVTVTVGSSGTVTA